MLLIVPKTAANAVKFMVNSVKETIKELEPSVYGKAEVKISGQGCGSADIKGVGVKANYKGAELASLSLGAEVSTTTGKITNISEGSYHGKDGNVKQIKGGGVEFFIGANRETETTINSGQVTNVKTSTDVSATPLPGLGALQSGLINENGRSTVKAGYVNGASVGLFLNFSASIEFGLQIKIKE